MAFDIEGARKAGYTDDEIIGHLTATRKFDVEGAKQAGYTENDIIDYLSSAAPAQDAETSQIEKPYLDVGANVTSQPTWKQKAGKAFAGIDANTQRERALVTTGLNTGASNILGMPVDTANSVLSLIGLGSEKPVFGSKWIREMTNPAPAKPEGFGERLIATGAELAPGFALPASIAALRPGAKMAGEAMNAVKMLAPTAFGSATARTLAPDNPYADMAAQIAGTMVGSFGLPKFRTIAQIEQELNRTIDQGIQKGLRPLKRPPGGTVQGMNRYQEAAREAVKDIVANKGGTILHDAYGNVARNNIPINAPQMVEAVSQGLTRNVKGYLDAVSRVTKQQVDVPLTRVENALFDFAADNVNQTMSPGAVEYALRRLQNFQGRSFTPEEFEKALQAQTSTVKKLINNPNKDIDHLHVEAKIQKALRETQDDLMAQFDGPEYRQFKNNYAALKQIEADTIQRARVTTRQGPYSLIDFSDVYSFPEIIGGIIAGNPMMVGKGLLTKGVAKYIKYANKPDTAIKRMFSAVDDLMAKLPERGMFTLESGWEPYYEAPEGVPVGQTYESYRPSTRAPVSFKSGLPVPTGMKRSSFPREAPTSMPSDTIQLLRHPMGELGLVPTGIKSGSFPLEDPAQVGQRLSIAERRMVGTPPSMGLSAIEMLKRSMRFPQEKKGIKRRAAGGDVSTGQTYLVGEEGPEIFTPNTKGHITPNHEVYPIFANVVKGLGYEQPFREAMGKIPFVGSRIADQLMSPISAFSMGIGGPKGSGGSGGIGPLKEALNKPKLGAMAPEKFKALRDALDRKWITRDEYNQILNTGRATIKIDKIK